MRKNLLLVITGAMMLCFMAFFNKFPLLTEASATYLNSRSGLYALFVAHVGWHFSIWLVVFMQGLLLSALLFLGVRTVANSRTTALPFLLLILLLTWCTPASILVSTIGPGIFYGLALLSVILLLWSRALPGWRLAVLAGIALLSMVIDQGHLLLYSSILPAFVAWNAYQYWAMGVRPAPTAWVQAGITAVVLGLAWWLESLPAMAQEAVAAPPQGLFPAIPVYPAGQQLDAVYHALSLAFNWELRESFLAEQHYHALDFRHQHTGQTILLVLSGAILLIALFVNKGQRPWQWWLRTGVPAIPMALLWWLPAHQAPWLTWQINWLLVLPACLLCTMRLTNHSPKPVTS